MLWGRWLGLCTGSGLETRRVRYRRALGSSEIFVGLGIMMRARGEGDGGRLRGAGLGFVVLGSIEELCDMSYSAAFSEQACGIHFCVSYLPFAPKIYCSLVYSHLIF
jgi:hypothetical protein